jgi:hypothetical protein
MGAGGVPKLCLWEMGKPELPSLLEAVYNSLVESSRMERNDGDPLRAILMKMTHELFPLGERLRLLKQSVMKSSPPKRMVSPREKPLQVRCSPSVVMMSIDE